MLTTMIVLSVIGFCLSFYLCIEEKKMKQDAAYKPMCDLSDSVSCSKVMHSQYAKLFFISNAVSGIFYFSLVAILAFFNLTCMLKIVTFIGFVTSCYLLYILFCKIKTLCIVCLAIDSLNIILFLLALFA